MGLRGRSVQYGFAGGLNFLDSPYDLQDNETQDAWDMRPVGDDLAIVQRFGDTQGGSWSAVTAATPEPQDLYYSPELARLMIQVDPNGCVSTTSGGSIPVLVQATNVSGVGDYTFVDAPLSGGQGPVYFLSPLAAAPSRQARYFDGTTTGAWTASAGTLPFWAKWLIYAGNRVWAAGRWISSAGDPDALYWSEIGDPRNWPAANIVKFAPEDGRDLTGIAQVGEFVAVFKSHRIWIVYDLDTGANRVAADIGGDVVGTTPEGVVFYSTHNSPTEDAGHLYLFDGFKVREIGRKLGLLGASIAGTYLDGSLLIRLTPEFDSGTGIYEYRVKDETWWRHQLPSLPFGLTSSGSRILAVRSGSTNTMRLFAPDVYTYSSGSALLPEWTSRYWTLGSTARKRIRAIELQASGRLAVTGRKDNNATSLFTSAAAVVPSDGRRTILNPGVARTLQLQCTGSGGTSADALRLDRAEVFAQLRTR